MFPQRIHDGFGALYKLTGKERNIYCKCWQLFGGTGKEYFLQKNNKISMGKSL